MSNRMNPVAKALWLEALRSGDYLQAKGVLKGERYHYKDEYDEGTKFLGHCCLGVLSEVAPPECGEFQTEEHDSRAWTFCQPDGYLESGVLPQTVRDWSGMHHPVGAVIVGTISPGGDYHSDFEVVLADLNDSGGFTFEQIADIVEYAL